MSGVAKKDDQIVLLSSLYTVHRNVYQFVTS